jgi:D-amino peptidase
MKVYISADMEGICGISSEEDVNPSSPRFNRALTLMEREVSWVCNILFERGVKDILINDAHWKAYIRLAKTLINDGGNTARF